MYASIEITIEKSIWVTLDQSSKTKLNDLANKFITMMNELEEKDGPFLEMGETVTLSASLFAAEEIAQELNEEAE